MTSWPPTGAQPAAIVPLDLSHLGLEDLEMTDARSTGSFWAEGRCDSGVGAECSANGEPNLWLAALRYDGEGSAGEGFKEFMGQVREAIEQHWRSLK